MKQFFESLIKRIWVLVGLLLFIMAGILFLNEVVQYTSPGFQTNFIGTVITIWVLGTSTWIVRRFM